MKENSSKKLMAMAQGQINNWMQKKPINFRLKYGNRKIITETMNV